MKLLSLSILLLAFNALSQNDSLYIEFVAESDSFPGCKTVYAANGMYSVKNQQLDKLKIPSTIAINPFNLSSNNVITSYANRSSMKLLGSYHYPTTFYTIKTHLDLDSILSLQQETVDQNRLNNPVYLDEQGFVEVPKEHLELINPNKKSVKKVKKKRVDPYSPMRKHARRQNPNKVIDGVYIKKSIYYYDSPFFEENKSLYDFYNKEQQYKQKHIQTQIDSLLAPFYISKYEVTNGDYHAFEHYVRDSIALNMAYISLGDSLAVTLLGISKKEISSIDITKREENLKQYGLKMPKSFYGNPLYTASLADLYHPQPERYYKRPTYITDNFIYRKDSIHSLAIYPDTTNFNTNLNGNTPIANGYYWHPAYESFPMVNLSMEQILAFCHWKEIQVNKEYGNDSVYIHVSPPSISQYEFSVKSMLPKDKMNSATDQQNNHYATYYRGGSDAIKYLHKVYTENKKIGKFRKSIIYYAFKGKINLKKDTLLNNLYDNVSEVVIDDVTTESLNFYGINTNKATSNLHYVLGANYLRNVIVIGDDKHNSIFYKTVRTKKESNCTTGFRLVYTIEHL